MKRTLNPILAMLLVAAIIAGLTACTELPRQAIVTQKLQLQVLGQRKVQRKLRIQRRRQRQRRPKNQRMLILILTRHLRDLRMQFRSIGSLSVLRSHSPSMKMV